jgi:1-acyl-sn-glycerol-3-phosphate acyltransferase
LALRPIMHTIFGVSVAGREHLRGLDQFIVVANHNSHLDTALLYCTLPLAHVTRTRAVAARDYFARHPVLRALAERLFRPIWIDRVRRDTDAVGEILQCLDQGCSVILYPEGTRGDPGRLAAFRSGIGRIVTQRPHIPVVPVFLSGPERALPKRFSMPVPLWNHVIIGPPQRLAGEPRDVARTLQTVIQELGRAVAERRHRRRATPRPVPTIAVLGIDGSGKSTLSRELARTLTEHTVGWIGDTLELYDHGSRKALQPLLTEKVRRWIGAQAKQAKSLARYKIPKLTELLLRDRIRGETVRWYRPHVVVMDGSPLLNMTAWAVLYREEAFNAEFCAKAIGLLSGRAPATDRTDPLLRRFPELRHLQRLHLDRLHLPDAVIFLDVAPEIALQRIAVRGEARQVHETPEKLDRLRAAYRLVCDTVRNAYGIPTCVLDGTQSRQEVERAALAFVRGLESTHHAD